MARIDAALRTMLVAATVVVSGCSYNNYISYGPGRVDYTGARVEFLEATPSAGSVIAEGSTVEFQVKVRYTLQREPRARIIVWFTNTSDAVLSVDATAVPIERAVSTVDTIRREIVVPQTTRDLVLHIGILGPGEVRAAGDLRLTYLVRKAG